MTFGTLAGMMARDYVDGRRNPWADLFEPSRTKLRGGTWDYLKENVDYPYYMLRDRFTGPEARTRRAVRRGEGKIVEVGGERRAMYRNEAGTLIELSPVCTHMGCEVRWNDAERPGTVRATARASSRRAVYSRGRRRRRWKRNDMFTRR
jgi:Rieske Fe-S protein